MRFNRSISRIILSVVFLFGAPPFAKGGAAVLFNKPLSDELAILYNGYSRYLDSKWDGAGWRYSVPSSQYKEVNKTSANNLRLQETFASAYRFRKDAEAKEKMRLAITNGLSVYSSGEPYSITKSKQIISTSSFNDLIGLYLSLALIQNRSDLFNQEEKTALLLSVEKIYPWALMAEDTENRALLGAAYGLAVLRHPLLSFSYEDKKIYQDLIRQKVATGIKSVGPDGIYREGPKKQFSLHYHLVSANMLAYLGQVMGDKQYSETAKKMFAFAHRRYPLGKLSWRSSARPRGIGLQTALLRALGEKFSGNKNWQEYWQKEKTGRERIDKAAPGRLAWRDEVDQTLNDDYSFISMAELLYVNAD